MRIEEQLADVVGRAISKRIDPMESRLSALEAKERGLDCKDGEPGQSGRPGPPGPPGIPGLGQPGRDGRDGVDGRDGKDGRDGVDGDDGLNGRDGVDGLGFDDLDLEYDGERQFTFRWSKGSQVKTKAFIVPVMLYRGVFDPARSYEPGDQVTYSGSLWIAKGKTSQRPDEDGTGARDWTLCAKRGPEGKAGKQGPQGIPGRDGVDLTQMDHTGKKW
jgi:hypothetical protein